MQLQERVRGSAVGAQLAPHLMCREHWQVLTANWSMLGCVTSEGLGSSTPECCAFRRGSVLRSQLCCGCSQGGQRGQCKLWSFGCLCQRSSSTSSQVTQLGVALGPILLFSLGIFPLTQAGSGRLRCTWCGEHVHIYST